SRRTAAAATSIALAAFSRQSAVECVFWTRAGARLTVTTVIGKLDGTDRTTACRRKRLGPRRRIIGSAPACHQLELVGLTRLRADGSAADLPAARCVRSRHSGPGAGGHCRAGTPNPLRQD